MRIDIDSFSEIAQVLRRNKSRTLLTAFGIFWGVFMLLFLMGGGIGLKALLGKNFDGFAANASVVISANTTKPYKGFRQGRSWDLEIKDIERIKQMLPEADVVTPEVSRWGTTATYGEQSYSDATVKGIYPDYKFVETSELKYGRNINQADVLQERKVCVIGKRIYNALFPDGGDPCGKFIQIGAASYQIVGVDFFSGLMSLNGQADESISIPLPVVQKVYNRGKSIDMVCIVAKPGIRTSTLAPKLREIVGRAHTIDPSDEPAIQVLNLEDFFSVVDNLMRGVDFLILLVGIGTILAGAIGVSNIMMVTVRERTTEIGIRRAIGAKPRDILLQIITEAMSITTISGSAGIVFSVFLLSLLEKIVGKGIGFQISIGTALASLGFIALLGILAGLAPASRAMHIKPVDAMRDE